MTECCRQTLCELVFPEVAKTTVELKSTRTMIALLTEIERARQK